MGQIEFVLRFKWGKEGKPESGKVRVVSDWYDEAVIEDWLENFERSAAFLRSLRVERISEPEPES